MADSARDDVAAEWHRRFASEANNRAWTLSEQPDLSADEREELLSAAHAAKHHWVAVGTPRQIALADLLLGRAHAIDGNGDSALTYATRAMNVIAVGPAEPWELAFAHVILAGAAAVAGRSDLHVSHYRQAKSLGDSLKAAEDREIFQATFRRIPEPADGNSAGDPPPPEPFAVGHLDVGNGHVLYYEQVGNPDGTPVLYLHGGPGAGCTPGTRRSFDLQLHRAVLFDQRASGRSTPHASEDGVHWASIDLDHHVADIERLREHLRIDRWIVFGVSWGSVLGAAYAERHPDRVRALVLAAVGTGTADDIDWMTVQVGRLFPAEWRAFRDHVPARLRDLRLVDAYSSLLMDPDPSIHAAAALAWCRWEDAHVATWPGARPNRRFADARFRLGFARQVTHCWRHDCWLAPDEIVRNAGRLANIPGWLIHGRLDLSSPLDAPWRLHRAWPGSTLVVVDDEGHGGETMANHWRRALVEACAAGSS